MPSIPSMPMATASQSEMLSGLQTIPLELALPLPVLAAYIALYETLAPRLDSEKKRAYILSVTTSAMMSVMSIPFVWTYATRGLRVAFESAQDGWRAELVRVGCTVFGVYLFADLALGYVRYRKHIGLLTGWIHHTVYIILMIHLLSTSLGPVFLIGAIMELPTFDLGISTIFPSLRSDERFLSSFFLIRIVFHSILLLDGARPSMRQMMDGSYVPVGALSAALILHVSWWRAGIIGYMKRRARNVAADGKSLSGETSAIAMTNDVAGDIESPALSSSALATPDDSPLVTPHTPSSSSSSPFANLPITISLPSIPTMQLPPGLTSLANKLPKTAMEMQSGFKEAVKSRWEGQMQKGMPMMSVGMGMLRRRRTGGEEEGPSEMVN